MANQPAPVSAAAELVAELEEAGKKAATNRWGRKFWNKVFWYAAVTCTATASVIGFVARSDRISYVQPWMVSLLAGAGASIEVFRNKTVWRDEEDAYAEYRDTLCGLVTRLRYELPQPPDPEQISKTAAEYQVARKRLTEALTRINKRPSHPAGEHRPG